MNLTNKSTSAQVRQDFENCFEHAEEGDIGNHIYNTQKLIEKKNRT